MYTHTHTHTHGLPGCSDGKASACNARNAGLIPGLGRSSGEGTWRIPWTQDPGGIQSMGCKESDTTSLLLSFSYIYIYIYVYMYIYIYTHTYLLSVLGTLKETEKAQEMKKNKQWGYKIQQCRKRHLERVWRWCNKSPQNLVS